MIKQDTTFWDSENKKKEYNRIIGKYRRWYKSSKYTFSRELIKKAAEKFKKEYKKND